jgi:hypothetical protein
MRVPISLCGNLKGLKLLIRYTLRAGNNVDLGTATESDYYYKEETKKRYQQMKNDFISHYPVCKRSFEQ